MNKFIEKKKTTARKTAPKQKEVLLGVEVLELKGKRFLICPKCGWQHVYEEEKCRFCGTKLRG